MTTRKKKNVDAWSLPRVINFFDEQRSSTDDVYASEWLFLKDALWEGMRVLDVGCAQGGFASVLGEHLRSFQYTGLDTSADMIARAREKHPDHIFHELKATGTSGVDHMSYDLVLVLGILHLHEHWRETLTFAWKHTAGAILFDLRETPQPSIENSEVSFFKMDFNGGGDIYANTKLPYNIINSSEALHTVKLIMGDAKKISHYGYINPVSASAVGPISEVMANTYFVEK